ncbi:copper homeostasis protein CutC [Mucilaginibacter aquatilis]|uniref:PF03932 family protein CutC n=1 Tax=Mucilaginibacter aquatilis TaxID=1517760 RepID=A0A6I4IDZ1_9SPHI|nr:copper homeostasis protein CutC [Mucilaginibacter aquatilis]MVN91826.1 copper homeostasis protein CutC [Mucilaginibacter aquatilis]
MAKIEICAGSLDSALIAQQGGAYRVELCDNLKEGGTTPSYAQIAMARKLLDIKLYVIIRPRGGDFLYSDLEFEIMRQDIMCCRDIGCDGVVFGLLTSDGQIDQERCLQLKEAAGDMGLTFHRAFDRCKNPLAALEDIIDLGFERILTSGLEEDALTGAPLISNLVKQANGRISIMPGAGVRASNLAELIQLTGAQEYHTTAKVIMEGKMLFRDVKTGSEKDEFFYEQTDLKTVKALVSIARSFN